MTLATPNAAVTTDFGVALHAAGDKFNLLGNPFGVSLDVSAVNTWPGRSNLASTVVQMWNANGGTYEPSVIRPTIAPWQGFFAEGATAGTLPIPASARTAGGVLQRSGDTDALVAFELTDGTRLDRAAAVRLGEAYAEGADAGDATKLASLDAAHVLLATGDGETLRSVDSRPLEAATLPLAVASVGAGADLVLTWPRVENLPADWTAVLRDLETGATVDLSEATSYAFSVTPTAARAESLAPNARAASASARFALTVGPRGVVATGSDAPAVLALDVPRPNPTAATATVGFALPASVAVRLSVVDLLGREVAVLADGETAARTHTASLDAAHLAPGVYVVRLATTAETLTQRVVVVR